MRGARRTWAWVLLAVLLAAASIAPEAASAGSEPQGSPQLQPSPLPQAGPIDPTQFRVGPGDVLVVWIWGPLARTLALEVSPDGQLFLPDFGPLPVAGLTLATARRLLADRIAARYRGVEIEVQLKRVRNIVVYLTGSVRQPGPVVTSGLTRLADILPESVFAPNASRRNILVRHLDGSEEVCDLGRFQTLGDLERLTWLRDGDVIEVPPATRFVGAWGALGRPGQFELGPEDSLATMLRIAAGPLPSAVLDRALLLRWRGASERESVWVSLEQAQSSEPGLRLQNGDNLYVFEVPDYRPLQQVTIVGQVVRTGGYPIRAGETRLSEVIRAAGGLRPDADSSAIQLVRARPERDVRDAEFERLARLSRDQMTMSEYEAFRTRLAAMAPAFRVDWRGILLGKMTLDPLLQPDDVIRVERVAKMIRVDGQVRRPGLVEFAPGARWGYYVRSVGGFTARAAHTQIRVTRSANGQTVLARNADAPAPGDFVWVPERPDVSVWQHLKDVLTISASFAAVWLAFRR